MERIKSIFNRTMAIYLIAVLTITLLPVFAMRVSAAEKAALSNFAVSNSSPKLKDNVIFSFDIEIPEGKEVTTIFFTVFSGKKSGRISSSANPANGHASATLNLNYYGTWEFYDIEVKYADGLSDKYYNSNTIEDHNIASTDGMEPLDMSGARAVVANEPTDDNDAPILSGESLVSSNTEISQGETASIYASISDASGIAETFLVMRGGKGGIVSTSFTYDEGTKKWYANIYGQYVGIYEIQYITLTDYRGNSQTYYNNKFSEYNNESNSMDMSAANITVRGENENDTEAPVIDISDLRVDRNMIGLNEKYLMEFKVIDDEAPNSIFVLVKGGKGNPVSTTASYDSSTQKATVSFLGEYYGTWEIIYISVTDANGNEGRFVNTAYSGFDEASLLDATQKGDASAANVYVGLSDKDTSTFISGDGMDNDVSLEITEDDLDGAEYEKLIEKGYYGHHFYHLNGKGTYFGNGHGCWVWFWLPFSVDGQWYRIRHLLSDGSIQTENVQVYGHWVRIKVWEFSPFLIESTEERTESESDTTSQSDTAVKPTASTASTSVSSNGASSLPVVANVVGNTLSAYVYNEKTDATSSGNEGVKSEQVKTSESGTAKVLSVNSDKKSVTVGSTVEVDGVSYKVKTLGEGALKNCKNATTVTLPSSLTKIEKGAFTGAKNLKTIRLNVKKSITVKKGAFNKVDTSKMTIKVNKKMSDKQYSTFQKTLKKAGYEGKVKRSL